MILLHFVTRILKSRDQWTTGGFKSCSKCESVERQIVLLDLLEELCVSFRFLISESSLCQLFPGLDAQTLKSFPFQ